MGVLNRLTVRTGARLNVIRVPSHLAIILRDGVGVAASSYDNADHLRAAIEWLCRAQDVTGCRGVSAGYYFDRGWQPPYPETTGYIIPTFLRYAELTGDGRYTERAVDMGNWEAEIQLRSGAVRGGVGINEYPIVFNTGQAILGWCALFDKTGERRFLDAALHAANWLISVQDMDGKWTRHTYLDRPHTYHTRVSWPLLEVHRHTGESKYKRAAERNIRWALTNVGENGWFENMGFGEDELPLTHTLAYTLRGLLECALHIGGKLGESILACVERAAEGILYRYEINKRTPYSTPEFLPARLDSLWKGRAEYSCLTGNCQIALVWLGLYQLKGDVRLLNGALKIIDQVKMTQSLNSDNEGIRGGIAGSYPIGGGYAPFAYPNWPPKFFADAVMRLESLMQPLEGRTL